MVQKNKFNSWIENLDDQIQQLNEQVHKIAKRLDQKIDNVEAQVNQTHDVNSQQKNMREMLSV